MTTQATWQALGACLHAARHRASFSQFGVAQQIGTTQAAYSQFERGLIRPRPELLCRLAIALRLDIALVSGLAGYPLDRVLVTRVPG